MARMMLCDAGDDREAAYLVTDLANGDATAWCQGHFTDLCATVTRAAEEEIAADVKPVTPQVVDEAGDGKPATVDVPLATYDGDYADVAGEELAATYDGPPTVEELHRSRTRRRLAERPDSAANSLGTVPEPGPPRR